MDERELLAVMRRAVAEAPPPMSEEPVLMAGRHALKRRRAMWASGASAAVVALMAAAGVALLAPSQGGGVQVGELPQEDRAAALADALDDLAPAGYGTPGDLTGVGDYAGRALKNHKAMPAGTVNGARVWNYAAGTPLTKGEGVGELVATVYTPGGKTTGEGCALSPAAWDTTHAQCTEVEVAGKKVALADVTYPATDGLPPAQWAGYRHADGTVVFLMQTAQVARSGRPALGAMPMTGQQLAAMAVDPRLKP